jgi:glycosyltransferase involved in cell wall biosynthesis
LQSKLGFLQKKKVIVSVINDLVTDQRVARTCTVLKECDYDVLLIGRVQKKSKPLEARLYDCKRMKLLFESGILFYLFFNIRLFFVLLFTKADVLFANDLDTLLPNYLVSKLKCIPLIYDSHEIFCEVPELIARPFKKRVWEFLEKWIVPKLKQAITVNESIATYFFEKYKTPFIFVRNIPNYAPLLTPKSRVELGLPTNKHIVILQGAGINVQRGAEELVASFQFLNSDYLLLIIGSGDVIQQLKSDVVKLNLSEQVIFFDKMSASDLRQYTINANLGITIDKDTNMNYHFSLPNKVFDYIHAGIPLLTSKLPEILNIVTTYQIGMTIDNHHPEHIAKKISQCITSEHYTTYQQNTKKAALDNNWETEKQKLIKLFKALH